MVIHEYQAKELMKKYGIPVPQGYVLDKPGEIKDSGPLAGRRVAVKAQVHVGGRGKAGGIKLADDHEGAKQAAGQILGMNIKGLTVRKVLLEEALSIDHEYYLGITMDRDRAMNLVMLSPMGGVDIEEVARTSPEAIFKEYLHPHLGLQEFQVRALVSRLDLPKEARAQLASIIKNLYRLYIESDATLAEINPLALYKGGLIAADGKINLDDNAMFRHREFESLREIAEDDPIERDAHQKGLAYVRLGGNVGIIGNGAGLVMATLDTVSQEGGKPANFLDIGGGARHEVVKKSLEVVLSDRNVNGLFINIFGGITRCDEVAKGIVESIKELKVTMPLVIRLRGTNYEEGKAILQDASLVPVETMQEGARKIVELTGKH